ncbi:MAG: type I-E CRISPR-associated protein Cse2/CasB [Peptoniphilaceae bacterium]|nr:type I-E CRISPR-associated protein Cse2/CasB [Peptoniphilaceae bacterium]
METKISNEEFLQTVDNIFKRLSLMNDKSLKKSILAKLRNSLGKPLSQTIEIWSILFEYLPEKFLSDNYSENYAETVILTTLQLYAVHQQGFDVNVLDDENFKSIGFSLSQLRTEENKFALDRRFNSMITSSTFDELSTHLRHLVKQLKSKSPVIKVDYVKLSWDLYMFLLGNEEKVQLNWARDYYKKKQF